MPKDTEEQRAALSIARGKVAARIKDPEKRRKFIARQGELEAKGKASVQDLSTETFKESNRLAADEVLGGVYEPHNSPLVIGIGKHVKYIK